MAVCVDDVKEFRYIFVLNNLNQKLEFESVARIGFFNQNWLTVAPGETVKVEDTWNFFIVLTVRGGQGE